MKTNTCPHCQTTFSIDSSSLKLIRYCPFCQYSLRPDKSTTIALQATKDTPSLSPNTTVSFLEEHLPQKEEILFSIGPYQVLKSIGKGGMGEVFLAYDTSCGRRLALKKIRPDLLVHKQLHNRFIKEARITSQLTHPAIIPIYAIQSESEETYYTMPYVEGETLKQLLRNARRQEKAGKKMDHIAESIPALIRIFLSICQAIAYSHSKNILHRDLKPENIIVGQYGQIVILDWGLAKVLNTEEKENLEETEPPEEQPKTLHHLTHVGKVVGTIAYMSPERAMGQPANFQTDIYSLGVILYQMLTLVHPFHRESLKEFRKEMKSEKLIDPSEIAPYRDVPKSLSRVVLKCLAPLPENRYQAVDDLIHDLENYIEGRSEWFQIAELNIKQKTDWEFQENVYIAEHVALTHGTEDSDWVSLMISKDSFQETIKIEARVKIRDQGNGIGFLLSIPETAERQHLNDGYCLWIGTENNRSTKLLRSTLEVMNAPDVFLKHDEWYDIRIEKIENNIHLFLNNIFQFSYISHLPLAGTHIGLLLRDHNFFVENFSVYVGSQNVTVNCLAVPDAFLAHKDYSTALTEYRRIGYSFPGRAEGREAMFRAGITLLEQANTTAEPRLQANLYDATMEEFQKLHNTPGAPLEYLGKALVYQALGDFEEEAKCFELAYRRYPRHPLLPILQEQIVYRMHESSRYNRQATFNFILLTLKYLPDMAYNSNTTKLLMSLDKHWETLFFIEQDPSETTSQELKNMIFEIKLAFWLGRPYVLSEIIDELIHMQTFYPIAVANALFCLIELGSWTMAEQKLNELANNYLEKDLSDFKNYRYSIESTLLAHQEMPENALTCLLSHPKPLSKQFERSILYLIEVAIDEKNTPFIHKTIQKVSQFSFTPEAEIRLRSYSIWAHLLDKNWKAAQEMLELYPIELLSQETSLLYFLYGCWLEATEGKDIAMIHFSSVHEVPYPRSWSLAASFLSEKMTRMANWLDRLFLWERKQLYRQLSLHYHCIGDEIQSLEYQQKVQHEVVEANH